MKEFLLEEIAQGCNLFISDLKAIPHSPDLLRELAGFPWTLHSLDACSYCFSYIFSEPLFFSNYTELYSYLKKAR